MKRIIPVSLILLASTLALPVKADRAIEFTPPKLGAPSDRIGGGSRGIGDLLSDQSPTQQPSASNHIQLLAPIQTGVTSLPAPTLYWYTSQTLPYDVEISISQIGGKPLFKKNIGEINTAGIQTIRLSDYGVMLENGKSYTWSITLIINPTQPTTNLSANATIRRETKATSYWYDDLMQAVETKSPELNKLLQQANININVK